MKAVLWRFRTPTRLVFGEGVSATVGQELRALGRRRPLVVTDAGIRGAGVLDRVLAPLRRAGAEPVVFDRVEANPSIQTVMAGARAAGDGECDAVIALGGGSPIDAAKAVAMMTAHEGSIEHYEIGKAPVARKGLPVITIPTTSGTGSEVTYWSVITDPETHRKFDVGSPLMAADVAIDDPELTYGLPPALTAATGMDALTHAMEALVTKNAAPHTGALAMEAIRLIGKYLPRAFRKGGDREARRMMMLASATAGLAFPNAGLGAVHGLTAPIGGHLDAPHGQANAALLPFVMEYNVGECGACYAAVARAWDPGGATGDDAADAARAIEMVRKMLKDMDMPTLADLGVTRDNAEMLARDSMGEFSNNNSNPVPLDVADAVGILLRAIAG